MRFFNRGSQEDALRAQVEALQQLLNRKRDELARAWSLANLKPGDRVVRVLAEAARVDEVVMASVLNAIMREEYSANASQMITKLVDEIERYLEGVDASE